MNTAIRYAGRRMGAPIFYAGWAGFALFGTLAALGSHAVLSYAVFHLLVAAAICTWYTMTTGRAAPIVSAVLGSLFGLQMVLFVGSDLTSGDSSLSTTAGDFVGLLAAVLILTGAVLSLRNHRASLLNSGQGVDPVRSPKMR